MSLHSGPQRLALFGGSFDPPHRAHLTLARLARDTLDAQVLWLPAGRPWQKAQRALAAPQHRLAMLRALLGGGDNDHDHDHDHDHSHAVEPGFVIDARELHRPGPSYTLDTVRELQAEQPLAERWLVIGQDQYSRLPTWHGVADLLASVSLAVAARDGESVKPPAGLPGLPHRVQMLPLPAMAISSTQVRAAVAAGHDVSALVGAAVARYISLNNLYRE